MWWIDEEETTSTPVMFDKELYPKVAGEVRKSKPVTRPVLGHFSSTLGLLKHAGWTGVGCCNTIRILLVDPIRVLLAVLVQFFLGERV